MPKKIKEKRIELLNEKSIIDILIRKEETKGQWSLIRYTMPPMTDGPPRHIHKTFDQYFYVLEGNPIFISGKEEIAAKPNSGIFIERNTPHTVHNPGEEKTTYLVFMTPGGFENFFEELSKLEYSGNDSAEEISALAKKFDEFEA